MRNIRVSGLALQGCHFRLATRVWFHYAPESSHRSASLCSDHRNQGDALIVGADAFEPIVLFRTWRWWITISISMTSAKDSNDGVKNYITPAGLKRLKDELRFLLAKERPAVTQVVAWAASNGDRSENADYQYNKRRLRQIDRRIRFLLKRIDAAEVGDPETARTGRAASHVFFGATVRYANAAGTGRVVRIVGVDEIDLNRDHISWKSPLARALIQSGPGEWVVLRAPGRTEQLQVLDVRYERIPVEPFSAPRGAEAAPNPRPRTGIRPAATGDRS